MDLREFIKALGEAHVYEIQAGENAGTEYVAISLKAMDLVISWLEQTADIVVACEDLTMEAPGKDTSIH